MREEGGRLGVYLVDSELVAMKDSRATAVMSGKN